MTSRAAPPCCSTDRCDTGVLRQRATGAPFLYGCCDIALIAARPGISSMGTLCLSARIAVPWLPCITTSAAPRRIGSCAAQSSTTALSGTVSSLCATTPAAVATTVNAKT